MLEEHYSEQFRELVKSLDWQIELPIEWQDFFEVRGQVPSFADDERHNQRLKARTHGILWFEQSLPFLSRTTRPVGIYTRDFSKQGVGFLSPFEIYPEEHIRIVLPTFWVQLLVVRVRRITSKCYEIGACLIRRHDPTPDAFRSGASCADPQCLR